MQRKRLTKGDTSPCGVATLVESSPSDVLRRRDAGLLNVLCCVCGIMTHNPPLRLFLAFLNWLRSREPVKVGNWHPTRSPLSIASTGIN